MHSRTASSGFQGAARTKAAHNSTTKLPGRIDLYTISNTQTTDIIAGHIQNLLLPLCLRVQPSADSPIRGATCRPTITITIIITIASATAIRTSRVLRRPLDRAGFQVTLKAVCLRKYRPVPCCIVCPFLGRSQPLTPPLRDLIFTICHPQRSLGPFHNPVSLLLSHLGGAGDPGMRRLAFVELIKAGLILVL